jgi:hypothetical protein
MKALGKALCLVGLVASFLVGLGQEPPALSRIIQTTNAANGVVVWRWAAGSVMTNADGTVEKVGGRFATKPTSPVLTVPSPGGATNYFTSPSFERFYWRVKLRTPASQTIVGDSSSLR